jgi:hypothetical protein
MSSLPTWAARNHRGAKIKQMEPLGGGSAPGGFRTLAGACLGDKVAPIASLPGVIPE